MRTVLFRLLCSSLFALLVVVYAGPAQATLSLVNPDHLTTPFIAGRFQSFLECSVINKSGGELAGTKVTIKAKDGTVQASTMFHNVPNGEGRTVTFQIAYAPGLRGGGYCHVEVPQGATVFANLVLRDQTTSQTLAEADAVGDLYGKLAELQDAVIVDPLLNPLTRLLTSGMLFGRYQSLFECSLTNKSTAWINGVLITLKNESAVVLAMQVEDGIGPGETRTLSFAIPYEVGLLAETYCHAEIPADKAFYGSFKLIDLNTKQTLAESTLGFDTVEFADSIIPICGDGIHAITEDCDEGEDNGLPSSCCTSECEFVTISTTCRPGSGDSCDPDEVCTGDSGVCPDDVVLPVNSVCLAGSGDICDPDDVCTGNPGDACVTDGPLAANSVCLAGSGDICDPDDLCTGNPGDACVTDGPLAANSVCLAGSGDICDPDDLCTGNPGDACVTDGPLAANSVCLAGSGDICDPDDLCTGNPGDACVTDGPLAANSVCLAGSGDVCDPDDLCTGNPGDACVTDGPLAANSVCLAGSGDVCDPDDLCTGNPGDACVTDGPLAANSVCLAGSGDVCDPDDLCTGNPGDACVTNGPLAANSVCLVGSGDICDPDDVCTGNPGDACVTDGPLAANSVCLAGSGDICDPDDLCTGNPGDACVTDGPLAANSVCLAGSGDICDPDDLCTGNPGDACVTDGPLAANSVCLAGSGDICDPDDLCTGNPGDACVTDGPLAANSVCLAGSGDVCDPDDLCTGNPGDACVTDGPLAANSVCLAGSGDVCDPHDVCTGNPGDACVVNAPLAANTVCLPGSGDICDPDDVCTGNPGDACVADMLNPGDTCGIGLECSAGLMCVPAGIWFVDNSVTGPGTGTFADPFDDFSMLNGAGGGGDVDSPGDIIFVYAGTGNYGPIELEDDQELIGEGVGLTSPSIPAGGFPTLTNVAGDAITLASGNTVRGLVAGDASGVSIDDGGGTIGTLLIEDVTINNTLGGGLRLANGGTVNVIGDNAATTSTGTAIDITNTTIGISGVTFESIDSTGSSANSAIILEDTGTGTFSVTGDGTASSGGTISNKTVDAITLDNTGGLVSLTGMLIEDIGTTGGGFDTRSGHDGIHGVDVLGGFTLDASIIRRISDNCINGSTFTTAPTPGGATVWTGLTIQDSTIEDCNRFHVAGVADGQDEGGVRILGLKGTALVDGSTFLDSAEHLDLSTDTTGTLDLTVTTSSFTNAYKEFTTGGTASVGLTCIDVTVEQDATANVTIGDKTDAAEGNAFLNCKKASVRVQKDTVPAGTGNATVIVANNTFKVDDHSSALALIGDFPQGGVVLRAGPGAIGTFDGLISNNTFGTEVGPDDDIGSTADEVMNADGLEGNVGLLFESGTSNVRVNNNTFNGSINAPWANRAQDGASANVLYANNSYRGRSDFNSPDAFFGTFRVPGTPYRTQATGGANLNISFENDDFVVQDQSFFPETETIEILQGPSGSGTTCVAFDDTTSPDGYELEESSGTLNLYEGTTNNAATGPCTAGSTGDCQTELADDGNRGGPVGFDATTGAPDPALNPPFVDVDAGSIDIIGAPCTQPPTTGIFAP